MLKTRLIPILLLQNGLLVRSERFSIHQVIGNPIHEVARFNDWNVDELIYLDITRDGTYDLGREDHKITGAGFKDPLGILEKVSESCFMPLTWGGNIRTLEDAQRRFALGADKIAINSEAFRTPALISAIAKKFGNQAVVISIDVQGTREDGWPVATDGGRRKTDKGAVAWAREAEDRGAGEILIQSIPRDGTGSGYDTDLIRAVSAAVRVPVIACSGVGAYDQYAAGIEAGASAVAAANIWHFKELSDREGKRALRRAGVDVRL